MLGCDVDDVVNAFSRNAEIGNVKRLRVNLSVGRNNEKLAELVKINVRRRENCLVQVLAGSCAVVVPGKNVDRENRGHESDQRQE